MSQNDEDFELSGFDYGTGSEDVSSNPASDGFVADDDFGENFEVQEQPILENNTQPRHKVNLGQTSSQQITKQARQKQVQQGNRLPNQDAPDYKPRRTRPQQQVQNQQTVQLTGGVDRNRVKSQQRVNPVQPKPQQSQVHQQQPPKRRQSTAEQVPNNSVPLIEGQQTPKKKKSKLPFILIGLALIGIVVGVVIFQSNRLVPQTIDYSKSGKGAYDNLITALSNYDATKVDSVVGTSTSDSYLAQEWSYANNNEIRQDFIISICANTSFTYPQVAQLSTNGKQLINSDGTPVLITSEMNNGEEVTVTHVDYKALSSTMQEDKEVILKLFEASRISEDDYDYEEEMTDLMLDYILSKSNLPTTQTNITLGVSLGVTPLITDDSNLDKLLFSSDDFHTMCDVFSQVATGFTGYKTENYTEKEEQENPDYEQWKIRFDSYYEADGGRFNKSTSKWEPWYKRDENNNYILDENGEKVVNYYSVKDEQGNDWIQPSEKIIVDVEKSRQVEVEWVEDSVIPYCFIGAYYCQNEYKGSFSADVRIGDGTIEYPAGVGTPIITKCLGTDGEYHDVKVTMTGYWKGQDAIDYAVSFSEKNRGFDINSVVQLICYEISIENLEKEDFSFTSELFLSDKNSNKSTRTGTMYGFYSEATVKAGSSVIINDWATSTELAQKYVTWGSSFNRVYNTVYFRVLAGEGDVPTYSAYKAFTGSSGVTGDNVNDTNQD